MIETQLFPGGEPLFSCRARLYLVRTWSMIPKSGNRPSESIMHNQENRAHNPISCNRIKV
jgi:hypothetical protein